MRGFSGKIFLAFAMIAAIAGGRAAYAQSAPIAYWIPGSPFGFGGDVAAGDSCGNFPAFDGYGGQAGGFSSARYQFQNGWFVGSERAALGFGGSPLSYGNFGSLAAEGVQFGYNFKGTTGLPVTVFGGFDTLRYNTGFGGPFAAFDNVSRSVPGYSAHAGVEFKPTSNLSLSFGVGYTQQSGPVRVDSDINAPLLPGASPFFVNGH